MLDEHNRVKKITRAWTGVATIETEYQYDIAPNNIIEAETTQLIGSDAISTSYIRDRLQRPTETTVLIGNNGYRQAIEYTPRQVRERSELGDITYPGGSLLLPTWIIRDVGTTPFVSSFKEYSMSGATATLVRTDAVEYDVNGNIVKYGGVTYEYDGLNKLTRENNSGVDKTIAWCYDVGGNIVSRTEYAYTTGELTGLTPTNTYTYTHATGWKDQLVEVKKNGVTQHTFSYDQAGNPTTYRGASLTWERGRNLANYHIEDDIQYFDMCYDASGKRASKRLTYEDPAENEVTTYYIYNGNNLVCEKIDDGGMISYKHYLYNSQGVIGYVIGNTVYTYRKNLFGDITAIYQGATKVAEYAYDAWGNCTIVSEIGNIGTRNPFRYRGYYWDEDLQLYYLMSRYYDPTTGRFINADSINYLEPEKINGLNLYEYCNNNPMMYVDPTGHLAGWAIFLIVVAALTILTSIGESWAYNNAEKIYEEYKDAITISYGHIENSKDVKNPFHIWALSAYVRYYTDSGAEGSSYGLAMEWICHNLGYHLFGMDEGEHLDFGKTILSDFEYHSDSFEEILVPIGMNVVAFILSPLFYLYDVWRTFE